ncbi:hypothetical protein F4808DRAFT_445268 [Astrocystis sublimbata]|nr:hypothetical protein F4808DRAFT_445268 [Astrocystis sublimbata]
MLDVPPGTPDRGPGIVVLCIVLMILVTLATIGRVVSKVVMRQYWWWDDFFALLSLPIQLTLLAIVLAWRDIGLGLHSEVVAAHNPLFLLEGAKLLYVAIFFFDTTISLPKLSAIFFYARIFNVKANNRRFIIHLWIAGGLVTGWIVSSLISTIFQCTPIEKAWNPMLPGTCINTFAWYLTTAAISVIVDFYILLLPVPQIWALELSLQRRIYLLAAFFLTYSVIVISIGRLVSTVNIIPKTIEDLTWNFPLYLYWAGLEGSISLISISAPNLIALCKVIASPKNTVVGSKGSESYKSSRFSTPPAPAGKHRNPVREADRDGFERLVGSEGSFSFETSRKLHLAAADQNRVNIPLDEIHVQTHISVTHGKPQKGGRDGDK